VHYEVDYRSRLWHGRQVQIELAIVRVGEKSMRYNFVVSSEGRVAATGNLVIAMAAPDSPHPVPWSDDVRRALTSGGPQQDTTGRIRALISNSNVGRRLSRVVAQLGLIGESGSDAAMDAVQRSHRDTGTGRNALR